MFGFSQKITDLVCKMKVDKDTGYALDYKDTKYYFCSENCKNKFNVSPKDYVAKENAAGGCCQQSKKSCC